MFLSQNLPDSLLYKEHNGMNDADNQQHKVLTFSVTPFSILLILLFLCFFLTHFCGLEKKPFHHDESIHANSSFNIVQGKGYRHDPVYHGPFLYYATAVILFLLGDSDYTVRVSPALFGMATFIICLLLARERLWAGRQNLWLPILLFVSPTMTYFSRFLIMDIYSCFFTVTLLFAAIRYFQSYNDSDLLLMGGSLALLYCVKDNSHITAFIFCSFLVLFFIWKWFNGPEGTTQNGLKRLFSRESWLETIDHYFVPHHILAKIILVLAVIEVALFSYVLVLQTDFIDELNKGSRMAVSVGYTGLTLGALVLLYYVLEKLVISRKHTEYGPFSNESLNQNEPLFLFYMLVIILFTLFYTNFLHHPERITSGLFRGIEYWLGQQNNPRIPGPFSYYFPLFLVYEFPLLIIVFVGVLSKLSVVGKIGPPVLLLGGWVLSTNSAWGSKPPIINHFSDLSTFECFLFATIVWVLVFGLHQFFKADQVLDAFFLFWSMMALLIYGLANEKVPWLATHQVLPLIFLASSLLTGFFKKRKGSYSGYLVLFLLTVGLAYVLRSNLVLNFYNEADPREIMVYVQSHPDVQDVLAHIDEIEFHQGPAQPLRIMVQEEANWPFVWYFRDREIEYVKNIIHFEADIIIAQTNLPDTIKTELSANGFHGQSYRLRSWWIADWKALWRKPGKEIFLDIRNYLLYRTTFLNKPASYDFMYYYRDPRTQMKDIEQVSTIEVGPADKDPLGEGVNPVRDEPAIKEPLVIKVPVVSQVLGPSAPRKKNLSNPKGIETGPQHKIYVVDSGHHRIQVYDATGNWLMNFGEKGSGSGQFNDPQGIAVDADGTIFVADTWNHRIQKFDAQGNFMLQFGQELKMWGPRDITISNRGDIFVSDTGNCRIIVFSKAGVKKNFWGFKGEKDGYFNEPVGLAMTGKDELVVADCGNRRVQIFSPDGSFQSSFPVQGWENYYSEPYVALDSADRIVLTDADNDRILVYSLSGELQAIIGESGYATGQMKKPKGITCHEHNYFVCDSMNNRVQAVQSPF